MRVFHCIVDSAAVDLDSVDVMKQDNESTLNQSPLPADTINES